MKTIFYILGVIIVLFLSGSCRKNEIPDELPGKISAKSIHLKSALASTSTVGFNNYDNDSIERKTVLGIQLTNPYLIPNMQQAYSNLGITNTTVIVTNLYVRFKPANVDQLDVLLSTMESQNLELFDTPVDYEVIYEGDYYQDPAVPEEEITWQYAVVTPGFQFPAGIQYETLAQIHIPGNAYTAVETEAENLASNEISFTSQSSKKSTVQPNSFQECPPGYFWDPIAIACVSDEICAPGYHWDGYSCVINPGTTPPPAADAAVPAGNISVFDTQFPPADPNRAVRKATIVARRWFKIERVFTDNTGHYQMTKRFKNQVRINVKFKNTDAEIRGVRGVRLWQMISPIKKTIGVFNGDANKSNIGYIFPLFTDPGSKGNKYWAGATSHNAVQDYREYAVQEGIGQPPTGIKIILTRLVSGAATPMWAKRTINLLPEEFVKQFLIAPLGLVVGGLNALVLVLKHQIDIAVSYQNATSDRLKETIFHELTHAAHYEALGNSWYNSFIDAEVSEIIYNFGGTYAPYGQSTGAGAGIIALGESWAYYMGHYLADKQYGLSSSPASDQFTYSNNTPINGLSSHINLLENWDPIHPTDPFKWISQGLFHDLKDSRNEDSPVVDRVSGYTNQQMFNAFQSDIYTLQDYRIKLIQQNNSQTSEIINLFNQYGY